MSIRPCAFRGNNPGFPEEYLRQPSLRPDLDATEPASPVSAFPTLATIRRPPNSSVNHNRSGRVEWAPAHLQRIAGGERESVSRRERCRRRRRSSGGWPSALLRHRGGLSLYWPKVGVVADKGKKAPKRLKSRVRYLKTA